MCTGIIFWLHSLKSQDTFLQCSLWIVGDVNQYWLFCQAIAGGGACIIAGLLVENEQLAKVWGLLARVGLLIWPHYLLQSWIWFVCCTYSMTTGRKRLSIYFKLLAVQFLTDFKYLKIQNKLLQIMDITLSQFSSAGENDDFGQLCRSVQIHSWTFEMEEIWDPLSMELMGVALLSYCRILLVFIALRKDRNALLQSYLYCTLIKDVTYII